MNTEDSTRLVCGHDRIGFVTERTVAPQIIQRHRMLFAMRRNKIYPTFEEWLYEDLDHLADNEVLDYLAEPFWESFDDLGFAQVLIGYAVSEHLGGWPADWDPIEGFEPLKLRQQVVDAVSDWACEIPNDCKEVQSYCRSQLPSWRVFADAAILHDVASMQIELHPIVTSLRALRHQHDP